MRDELYIGRDSRTEQPVLATSQLQELAPLFAVFEELTFNDDGCPLFRTYQVFPLLGCLCIQYAPRLRESNVRVERAGDNERVMYTHIGPDVAADRPRLIALVGRELAVELMARYGDSIATHRP